jgi:hypothetical protein
MQKNPLEIEYFYSNNIFNLKPWEIISGDRKDSKEKGIRERYPQCNVLPFAVKTDGDDVACFDLDNPGEIVVIHDYSTLGWSDREVYADFWKWLEKALSDFISFAKDDIEYERSLLQE